MVANSPVYYVQGRHHCLQMSKRSLGPACVLPARPYWKFRGRELQSAIGCFLSLGHESEIVYLLLFVTLTHLRASRNC